MLRIRGLFIVALAIASMFFTPPPAHAITLDATCTVGQVLINWSPGITATLTPPAVNFDGSGTLGTCIITNPLGITAATLSDLNGNGNISCLTSNNVTGSFKLTWQDTSQTSMININSLTPNIGSASKVIVLTGTVQPDGRFAGDTVIINLVVSDLGTLQCLAPNGLEHSSSTLTAMTVTSP